MALPPGLHAWYAFVAAHGSVDGLGVASATTTGEGEGVCCVTIQSSVREPQAPAVPAAFLHHSSMQHVVPAHLEVSVVSVSPFTPSNERDARLVKPDVVGSMLQLVPLARNTEYACHTGLDTRRVSVAPGARLLWALDHAAFASTHVATPCCAPLPTPAAGPRIGAHAVRPDGLGLAGSAADCAML